MLDDLVDLCPDEAMAGKTLGTDLQKGKFTPLLLMVLEKLSVAAAKELLDQFDANAAEVVAAFNTHIQRFAIFEDMHQKLMQSFALAAQTVSSQATFPAAEHLLKLLELVRLQLGRLQKY